MNYYANTTERLDLINGLRVFADFLEENAEIPAPARAYIMVFPGNENHDMACGEIDRIAALIGTAAIESESSHYRATRAFGPLEYSAIAIPPAQDEDR